MSHAPGPTAIQVDLGCAIAEVLGHYRVALELLARGRSRQALIHAQHPLIEVLPRVERTLASSETKLVATFGRALAETATAVRQGRPASDIDERLARLNAVARECLDAIAGGHASAPGYAASLVAALLARAADEYALALELDETRRPTQYEGAYGFVRQAIRMFDGLSDRLAPEPAREVRTALQEIQDMVPDVDVPSDLAPEHSFHSAVERARSALSTVPGFVDGAPSEEELIGATKSALQEVIAEYSNGRPERAMDAAGRALLHHFQPLAERLDPEEATEFTTVVGVELRKAIARRVELASLRPVVARALSALDRLQSAQQFTSSAPASLRRKGFGVGAPKDSSKLR